MKSRSIYISIFIVCLTRCASMPLQITDPTTTFHWLCTTKYVLFEIADLFIWSILCEDLLAFSFSIFLSISSHSFFFHRHFDCCLHQMNLLIIITRFPGSTMIIVHFITNEFCTLSLKYFLSVCGTKIKREAMRLRNKKKRQHWQQNIVLCTNICWKKVQHHKDQLEVIFNAISHPESFVKFTWLLIFFYSQCS